MFGSLLLLCALPDLQSSTIEDQLFSLKKKYNVGSHSFTEQRYVGTYSLTANFKTPPPPCSY